MHNSVGDLVTRSGASPRSCECCERQANCGGGLVTVGGTGRVWPGMWPVSAARELASPARPCRNRCGKSQLALVRRACPNGQWTTGDRLACGAPGRGSASQRPIGPVVGEIGRSALIAPCAMRKPDVWQRSRYRFGLTPFRPLLQTVNVPMAMLKEGGLQIRPQRETTPRQAQYHPPF